MLKLQDILTAHLNDAATCDSVAYIQAGQQISYRQLFGQAAWLREQLGTERDNPVLVCGHKEPAMLAGFLACIAAGRPFVPIDQSLPATRVRQISAITEARHAIVCNDQCPATELVTIDARQPPEARYKGLFDAAVTGQETAYIIFTSGTTGEPKGVKIPAEALDDFINWTVNELFPATPAKKVWMNQAVFSFDLSVFEIWTSVATAGTLIALDSASNRNTRAAFRDLAENSAQMWVSTPSYAELCLLDRRFSDQNIPTLEHFVFCGEVLHHRTAQALMQRFPKACIWNLYGPTETTCATTGIEITPELLEHYPVLPVGYAKPGTRISVDDGEIIISGTNVGTGYINRPDLTAHNFFFSDSVRSYRSGDQGELDDTGLLFCRGRTDSQIKLNGYRIELDEISTAVCAVDGIDSAACIDLHKDGRVVAIGCCFCGSMRDVSKLKKTLQATLPAYMIPSRFLQLDALPLTRNGKLHRQAVRQLFT